MLGNFPWYFLNEAATDKFSNNRTLNTSFFVHMFYANDKITSTAYHSICLPIINSLELYTGKDLKSKVWNIKANLYTKDGSYPKDFHHPPHIDNTDDNFTGESFLYYVNDADGDTFMFDDKFETKCRITPEKGKGVLFDLKQYHTSSIPRIGGPRITLNFVFGEYASLV